MKFVEEGLYKINSHVDVAFDEDMNGWYLILYNNSVSDESQYTQTSKAYFDTPEIAEEALESSVVWV